MQTADHPDRERARHDDRGPVPADRPYDVAAQRRAVFDDAVAVVEELHDVHADGAGAGALLRLAQGARLIGVHPVDAGLSARGQAGS